MILAAHQPAYLPWLGYFDKIMRSDVFVFLDKVQFEKNSFINRNKIKIPNRTLWLTIPIKIKGHTSSKIKDIQIDNTHNWRKKHLEAIYLNYKKSSRFAECYAKLENLYSKEYDYLSDLCWDHIKFWLKEIGSKNSLVRLSDLPINNKKSDLVLELCKYFGSNHYISGSLGKNYLNEEDFVEAGITIEYQNYQHPTYPQMWGDFIPNLSILDFFMNSDQYWLIKDRVENRNSMQEPERKKI